MGQFTVRGISLSFRTKPGQLSVYPINNEKCWRRCSTCQFSILHLIDNMPKLVISGTVYELVEDLITIGRGPDNTIIINDPSVSTHHAQLQLAGETYRLKDLDSTNGTRVNGIPVTETVLHLDDRIRFGA